MSAEKEIGILSDTHGLVRPESLAALRGVCRILHAGDIGGPDVLAALERIAPVSAVRGNTDGGAWARLLPASEWVEIEGRRFYLIHDIGQLDLDPKAAGLDVVVYGHSHRPSLERRGGVLHLNPGSAGPRRFRLPVTLVRLALSTGELKPRYLDLEAGDGSEWSGIR